MSRKLVIALSLTAATVGVVAVATQLRSDPTPGEAQGGNCAASITVGDETWNGVKTDTPNSGPSQSFAANTVFCVKAANMNSGTIGINPPWPGGLYTTGPSWNPPNADISNYVIYGTLPPPTTTTTLVDETTTTLVDETTTTLVDETTTTLVDETTTTLVDETTTTEAEGPVPLEVATTTTAPAGPIQFGVPGEPDVLGVPDAPVPASPSPESTPQQLPVTGSGLWEMLLLAAAVMGGGIGVRILARRD